jgi:hypothetical protein
VRFIAIGFLACVGLCGCAIYSNGPTESLVHRELLKTKKLVTFSSDFSPSRIRAETIGSGCGTEVRTDSAVTSAGPGIYLPIISKNSFSVQEGNDADGSIWVVLRMDGMIHAIPSGIKLVPTVSGGSEVTVMAADIRKVEIIKKYVEEGTVFCHWREFDYPYD